MSQKQIRELNSGNPTLDTLLAGQRASGAAFNFPISQIITLLQSSGVPVTIYSDATEMLAGSELVAGHFALAGEDLYVFFGGGQDEIENYLLVAPYKPITVRAVATDNITIATALNNGDTLDTLTLADGDWVLAAGQTDATERLIWVVGSTPTIAPVRYFQGMFVLVREGSNGANRIYQLTSPLGEAEATVDSLVWTNRTPSVAPEYGTFSPTLQFGGESVGVTYGSQNGHYVRQVLADGKKLMFITVDMIVTSKGSSSGDMAIGGLPEVGESTVGSQILHFGVTKGASTFSVTDLQGRLTGTPQTRVTIYKDDGSAAVQDTDLTVSTSITFRLSGTYIASA